MQCRSIIGLSAVLAAFIPVAAGRDAAAPGCGTHLERGAEELYLHHQAEQKRGLNRMARSRAVAAAAVSTNRDYGNIAVVDDGDGVLAQRNDFNLNQKTVAFLPTAVDTSRYRVQTGTGSYDSAAANAGTKLEGLGDDDTRQISLPFTFPYFGASYRDLWVNSDGNLTFGRGDGNSTDRSLGRMAGGAPRIAPLFTDLDPSSASGTAGVRVLSESGRVVISWKDVPLFSDYGGGSLVSFQVRLYPDGRIEFAYLSVAVSEAVTGIAPGNLKGSLALVSLASGPQDEYPGGVADRFSATPSIDVATMAQKFYATHEDAYDYLVIYNAVGVQAASGAVAYEVTVRNDRSGYGDRPVQTGEEFGSRKRLQAVLNMGPLNQYPDDPNGVVAARGPTGDTSLTVLGHETGHLFLAFASVRDPNNAEARPMLGRALVHWSFDFNSEASFLEGTRLLDRGAQTSPEFLTVATVQGYAPLDQYLMGFRAPEEVPPTFLVTDASYPATHFPQSGIAFDGVRRNVTVQDIIAAEGRRTPDATVAQRHFRFAFILVTHLGQTPVPDQISKVDNFRTPFETFYSNAASGRATASTLLQHAVQLSVFPAGGVLANGPGSAALSLETPASVPRTFTLSTSNTAAQVPTLVIVPAGSTQVAFPITGVREGVADLTATPSDSSYEIAHARIQVTAAPAALTLELVSKATVAATPGITIAPVQVRVVDSNLLPYTGVRVTATVPHGVLDSYTATTGENGTAQFRWTPSISAGALRVAIEGAPNSAVTVALTPVPAIASGGVVNAASFAPGITPGSLATIFGAGLSGGTGNVQVWLNGITVPVSYAGDSQVNFLVPAGLAGNSAAIEIQNNSGGRSPVANVAVKPISPGIFSGDGNAAAVLIAGTGLTTLDRPAHAGDAIEIYATGLSADASNPLPQVIVGGAGTQVLSSTALTQFPGLYQVNAVIAAGTPSGDQPITLVQNGIRSNQPLVRIQ